MPVNKKGKYKVLIIEDEETLMQLIANKLEKDGYQVARATDGEAGFNKIKSEKPDLVLLDIIMPKMNGYEVLEKINEEGLNVPVIIISNSGQPVEIEKTQELGAVDYLIKTQFEPAEVSKKVKSYLENKNVDNVDDMVFKPREDAAVRKLNLNVLLVEDDPFLREICSKKLVKEGYTVYEAVDGLQAIKAFAKVKPQIVLLDIILPSIDGFQVLKKIRSDEDSLVAQVPVIMLSNLGQEDDVKKAMDLGANDYLIKAHFTTDEIADRIDTILKK